MEKEWDEVIRYIQDNIDSDTLYFEKDGLLEPVHLD